MLTLFRAQGAKTIRKWAPQGLLETPYKRASQEWDDRMGSALVQAFHWRLACFALAAVAMIYAVIDASAVARQTTKARRELAARTIQDIEQSLKDKESKPRR